MCDKIVPGLLIGALHFGHLPAVFVPAGPMTTGMSNKEKARIRQLYAQGKATREELLECESASYHGAGTCTFYGTANSNQSLLNIQQGTNVTITNVSGTTTINASGGPSFTTAGQGFFFGFQDVLPISDGAGTFAGVVNTNNAIGVAQLNLLYTITVRKVSAYVITASGSGTMYAAIYSADGNTKLIEATGGFDAHNASQVLRTVTLGSPVTLSPGSYLFACGTDNTSTGSVAEHGPYNANFLNNLLNASSTRVAQATNTISGAAMPATLGALTPFDHSSPTPSLPAVMFYT